MKKLQRYEILMTHAFKNDAAEWCHTKDVSALEAENERLREVLLSLLADDSTCFGGAGEWYKRTDAADAILSEQEKQP